MSRIDTSTEDGKRCIHLFGDNGICTHCGDDKDYYCAPPPVVNRVKIKVRSVTKGKP